MRYYKKMEDFRIGASEGFMFSVSKAGKKYMKIQYKETEQMERK